MVTPEAQARINAELDRAENARAAGLEGQARVCARRAAGEAIRDFLTRHGKQVLTPSATDLLSWLQAQPEMPAEARRAAGLLLLRVTPEHELPIPVDLLAETRNLIQILEHATYPE